MLTREQKIDFLKCCIVAYEHPHTKKLGFCSFFEIYCELNRILNDDIYDQFFEFREYMFKNPMKGWGGLWIACYDDLGYAHRAKIARQFLKKEYGITVPKREK